MKTAYLILVGSFYFQPPQQFEPFNLLIAISVIFATLFPLMVIYIVLISHRELDFNTPDKKNSFFRFNQHPTIRVLGISTSMYGIFEDNQWAWVGIGLIIKTSL